MSKQNNVNPDHYKIAGRDRAGDTGNVAAKDPREPHAVNRGIESVPGRRTKKKSKTRT